MLEHEDKMPRLSLSKLKVTSVPSKKWLVFNESCTFKAYRENMPCSCEKTTHIALITAPRMAHLKVHEQNDSSVVHMYGFSGISLVYKWFLNTTPISNRDGGYKKPPVSMVRSTTTTNRHANTFSATVMLSKPSLKIYLFSGIVGLKEPPLKIRFSRIAAYVNRLSK